MTEAPADFITRQPGSLLWPPELLAYTTAMNEAACIAIANEQGIVVQANANFCKASKYSERELTELSQPLLNPSYHSEEFIAELRTNIKQGNTWKGELKNKAKDQSVYWMNMTIAPFVNAEGKRSGYVAIGYEITERKNTEIRQHELEENLRKKGEELSNVLDKITDGFIMLDRNFCYLYANKRIGEMTGRDPATLIGKNMWHEFPDAVGSQTYLGIQKAMLDRLPVHNVDYYEPYDLWQENQIYPTEEGLSIFIRDITQQKRAELELQKKERVYRTITANIPGSVIIVLDTDLVYRLIEGDLLEKLGYAKENMLNRNIHDVLPQARYELLLPYFKRALAGEQVTMETKLNSYDIITRFVPLKNTDNSVYSIMTVGIDISELKRAERLVQETNLELEKKVQERTEQLEGANKDLEAFSYSVAHDLRSPLRALSGYSAIVLEDHSAELNPEAKRLLNAISTNAKKMGHLIDDLLTFSRLGRKDLQLSQVNMNELADVVIAELRAASKRIPEINLHHLHPVEADISLLKHVLINLLSNAIKYSSKVKNPLIRVASVQNQAQTTFSIKDNGVGFDEAFKHKLFGVFQRLHSDEEFEGTGVGLAIVKRVIERHAGRVWAESKPGEGATFYFCIPTIKPSAI